MMVTKDRVTRAQSLKDGTLRVLASLFATRRVIRRQTTWIWILAAIGCAVMGLVLMGRLLGATRLPETPLLMWFVGFIHGKLSWIAQYDLRATLLNPLALCAFATILMLEKLFPARPSQGLFTVGLAYDFVWLLLEALVQGFVVTLYVNLLYWIYKEYLGFLTVESIARLPGLVLFLWALLLADFLQWFHHWVRHKVPLFWHFHVIHHSQRQLNMFTDMRYHIVEYLVSRTIITFRSVSTTLRHPGAAFSEPRLVSGGS